MFLQKRLGRWIAAVGQGKRRKVEAARRARRRAPDRPRAQAHLADAWWELAATEGRIARDSIRLHAGAIYRLALPNLASTLRKATIERRLKEIAVLESTVSPISVIAAPAELQYAVNEYSWKLGQPNVRLIQKNKGFCFLAAISGRFEGYGEAAGVHLENGGFWSLDCAFAKRFFGGKGI